MAGNTFVTQEAAQVSATSSFSTRVTQAALSIGATSSFSTRLTQIALGISAWTAFQTRMTQLALSVWVISLGSTSLPAGVVIPPDGTTTDHLTPTDVCCPGLWTGGTAPCPGWVDGSAPATSWTANDC